MTRTQQAPPSRHLSDGSVLGGWWHEVVEKNRIICDLCPRACSLKPGDRGFCFVRQNVGGEMVLTTYGRSTGFCVDPIEKKPLNHFLPNTAVLSFGTAGCNLGCKFCQNWDTTKSREVDRASAEATPETIAEAAVRLGCHSVAFTYNDPVIWAEYAVDTARACHARGVRTVAVTAGYITAEARPYFFQEIDAANVDLKAFGETFYRQLTYSHLQPVLDTLEWLKRESDVWFEITNLMIPSKNDAPDEVQRMCGWIVDRLGDEVPVHFTAFHPNFRLLDVPATPLETLLEAYDIARRQGIKYVYVGNVQDSRHASTYCPHCSKLLMERHGYELGTYHLQGNRCGYCSGVVAGVFLDQPGQWGARRQPVRISDFARPSVEAAASRSAPEATREPRSDSSVEHKAALSETKATTASHPASGGVPLTARQQRAVFRAACEFLVADVAGRPVQLSDPTLDGSADLAVMGAFVTLKRQQSLRACCGSLGQPMRLFDALRAAARRTATDDRRLPPISTTELSALAVDVSLLHSFSTVAEKGSDRAQAVEVGRHGLIIRQGSASGLLLPGVATENGWDRETFLRQVCRKAGLPPLAWQEDTTQLQTFEATVIEGRIEEDLLRAVPPVPMLLTDEELSALSRHCNQNLRALLQGATPSYYLPSCRDMNVQGVLLSWELPSRETPRQFARLSVRPGLPLQSTLFQLCESAAHWFSQTAVPRAYLDSARAHVAILHDSAAHGTVADPDLQGLDTTARALAAAQHGRYAWRYAPNETPEQLLHDVKSNVQVFDPQSAPLFSFAVDSNVTSFSVSSVPRPQAGPDVRPPAVAGVFYPSDTAELSSLVDQLLAGDGVRQKETCPAVIVPHAGLRYSGQIAAAVLQRVAIPELVIVLAPKHTHHGTPWAVAPHETWSLPGGCLESDPELARLLAARIPRLELDAAAHREEHAIEVLLPLLARLAPDVKVVGITLGEGDLEACQQFADRFATVLPELSPHPLLIVSTDLNHYAPEAENRRLDAIALESLHQLDPAHLYRTVRDHDISMCGLLPAVATLQTLQDLDTLHSCEQIAYATSADAGGNPESVVGYAGLLLR